VTAVWLTDGPPPYARDHQALVFSWSHLARMWAVLERHSAWLVVNTQVKACFRETHSLSRASRIYGYEAFQITHYTPLLSTVAMQHYSTPHTLWGCAVELASALTAATILADAGVTPTVSEMTYSVSSGTLNHTLPSLNLKP